MTGETDRRQQILDAAFDEFAAKGFRGATIKGIAARAGLQSPALLYWYFPRGKEELFYAAVEAKVPFLATFRDPEPLMDQPPETVLPMIARTYLDFAARPAARQLLRLLLAELPQRPRLLEPLLDRGPLKVLGFLSAYLQRQADLGRLRPHDARSSARAFVGMLVPQALAHVLLPQLQQGGPSDEEHVRTVTEIFLTGLRPEPEEATHDGG